MEVLPGVLKYLILILGIKTPDVISRDGFLIEEVPKLGVLDTESIGTVISAGIGSSEVMGRAGLIWVTSAIN